MTIGNSPADDRPSIGHVLTRARVDAGLTIEEVSTVTRVRVPIVFAIEQDDFSRCGGDVYARGHLRSLARAVGLDPAELVERYDAEHGGQPEPTQTVPMFEAERIRPERRGPNWTAAMIAAIVAVVAFVGFTFFSGGSGTSDADEEDSTPTVADGPPASTHSGTPSGSGDEEPSSDPSATDDAIADAPANKVTVKLTADVGQSWISAQDHNGRLLHQGVLRQGESKTFTDSKRIDLVLGNAAAIQLFVNGKEVEHGSDAGAVQRLSYTRGDPEAG